MPIVPVKIKRLSEHHFVMFRECNDERFHSQEDKCFLKKIERGITYVEGHHQMPLPFRDDDILMPSNKGQAAIRANWLKKKLKNENFHKDYTSFMHNILEKGYARKLSHQSIPPAEEGKDWYLPHHGVYHAKKPTKIRVVFDCSTKFAGMSLNDKLLQGPDLTNSLIGVLARFREEQVAFMGDIESIFHQVRVNKDHRNYLRFLWWPDGDLT